MTTGKNIKVACAVIHREGKILVTQRGTKMSLPLKWEFPGGKMEQGETVDACVKREIKEELNIEIEITGILPKQYHNYGSFSITLLPVLAQYNSGEIHLIEHNSYKWLYPSDFESLDWAEADLGIVDLLMNSADFS